jgi:MSHA pilin protein MshA
MNKKFNIKKQVQKGFTLIELVVVIVILGILAATAVPKFGDLTTQANTAVADGIAGAVVSAAVIQLGVNSGASSTLTAIKGQVTTSEAFTTSIDGAGCSEADQPFTVTVTSSSQVSGTAQMPAGLCSGT